jgi:hypothetical protein
MSKPNLKLAAKQIKEVVQRPSILDKGFIYVSASRTNVQNTWRKHGWVSLSEQRS